MTVAEISKRAKQIRAKSPSKKWTDCIKQASKELKADKRTTGKVGATKKVVLDSLKKLKKNEQAVLIDESFNPPYDVYAVYVDGIYDRRIKVKKGEKYLTQKQRAIKSSSVKQTKSRRITGSHTDTKSHNVRINVLSGMQGTEIPVTLNGVKTLTKGAFYLYTPENGKNIFKYIGKSDTVAFPLIMDSYTKNAKGSYIFNGRYVYSSSMLKSLKKIKTPTAKELSIGHLKLLK